MPALKAVCFDLWKTLYADVGDAGQRRADIRARHLSSFLGAMNVLPPGEQIRSVLASTMDWIARQRRDRHRGVDATEIGVELGRQLGYQLEEPTARVLGEYISAAGVEAPPQLVVGAAGVLDALRGRLKMAIICDTGLTLGAALRRVMQADLVLGYFEHCTFSDETHSTKPMERQFLHTLGGLGVRPDEAVHVGDSERRDVLGAKRVGMRAIRLDVDGAADSQADAVVRRIDEVTDVLDRWSQP